MANKLSFNDGEICLFLNCEIEEAKQNSTNLNSLIKYCYDLFPPCFTQPTSSSTAKCLYVEPTKCQQQKIYQKKGLRVVLHNPPEHVFKLVWWYCSQLQLHLKLGRPRVSQTNQGDPIPCTLSSQDLGEKPPCSSRVSSAVCRSTKLVHLLSLDSPDGSMQART